jgi:hypothetical protein
MECTHRSKECALLSMLEELRQQLTELGAFRALPGPVEQAEKGVDRVSSYVMIRNHCCPRQDSTTIEVPSLGVEIE